MSLKERGSLVAVISPAKDLGLDIQRSDHLPYNTAIEQVIGKEAEPLGTVTEIPIIKGRESIIVCTTIAASPHTIFTVPYPLFDKIWREKGREIYPNIPDKGKLIPVIERQEGFVPLHLITWVFGKGKDKNGKVVYYPVDYYDLIGIKARYDREDPSLLADLNPSPLADLDPEERVKVFETVFEELKRRMIFHSQLLAQLYKDGVYPRIIQAIGEMKIDSQLKEKLLETLRDPGYVDHTLPVGYYSKWQEDRLGRGPQSNPSFHSHSAIYPPPERIWQAVCEVYQGQGLDYDQRREIFEAVLTGLNPAFSRGLIFEEIDDETYFKQVDPYSMIFFRAAQDWIKERFRDSLRKIGLEADFQIFTHRSTSKQGIDMRFSQGIEIEVPLDKFTDLNLALADFVKPLYDLWRDYLSKKGINYIKDEYGLPDNLVRLIERIESVKHGETSTELNKARGSRLGKFKNGQLVNPTGYNIPGLPSWGGTFEFDNARVIATIGPLLSKKGVAEQIIGIPVRREEAG